MLMMGFMYQITKSDTKRLLLDQKLISKLFETFFFFRSNTFKLFTVGNKKIVIFVACFEI